MIDSRQVNFLSRYTAKRLNRPKCLGCIGLCQLKKALHGRNVLVYLTFCCVSTQEINPFATYIWSCTYLHRWIEDLNVSCPLPLTTILVTFCNWVLCGTVTWDNGVVLQHISWKVTVYLKFIDPNTTCTLNANPIMMLYYLCEIQ